MPTQTAAWLYRRSGKLNGLTRAQIEVGHEAFLVDTPSVVPNSATKQISVGQPSDCADTPAGFWRKAQSPTPTNPGNACDLSGIDSLARQCARHAVNTGCKLTISAATPADSPIRMDTQTPPRYTA